MNGKMDYSEAMRYIEIADIKINGKNTQKEAIGEFREFVKNAVIKTAVKRPERVSIIDKNGAYRESTVCLSCGWELTDNAVGMNYCPNCGQKLRVPQAWNNGRLVWFEFKRGGRNEEDG